MAEPELPVVFFALRDAARVGFQLRTSGGSYLMAVRRAAAVTAAQALLDAYDDALVRQVTSPGGGRSVPGVEVVVESAMQTPDRLWRLEVVRRRGQRTRWYGPALGLLAQHHKYLILLCVVPCRIAPSTIAATSDAVQEISWEWIATGRAGL
jgi:hypothetical protein